MSLNLMKLNRWRMVGDYEKQFSLIDDLKNKETGK